MSFFQPVDNQSRQQFPKMWFSKDYIFQIYGLYSVGTEKSRLDLLISIQSGPMNYVEHVSPTTKVTKIPEHPKNVRNAPNFDYLDLRHINPYPRYESPKFAPKRGKNGKWSLFPHTHIRENLKPIPKKGWRRPLKRRPRYSSATWAASWYKVNTFPYLFCHYPLHLSQLAENQKNIKNFRKIQTCSYPKFDISSQKNFLKNQNFELGQPEPAPPKPGTPRHTPPRCKQSSAHWPINGI